MTIGCKEGECPLGLITCPGRKVIRGVEAAQQIGPFFVEKNPEYGIAETELNACNFADTSANTTAQMCDAEVQRMLDASAHQSSERSHH